MFNPFAKKQKTKVKPNIKVYGSASAEQSTEEILSELRPPTGLKKFATMEDNESIISGLLLRIAGIIKSAEWTVEGKNADFVLKQLKALPYGLSGLLEDFSNAFTYGFSINEKIWAVGDGQIYLADVQPRPQTTIEFVTATSSTMVSIDNIGFIRQQTIDVGTVDIPYAKCVHFIPRTRNRNPYGRSLLRGLYKPYYYKSAIEASEAQSIDRSLSGLPVMTAPEGFDFVNADTESPGYDANLAATLEWAEQVVSKVRKDEMQGIVKPSGWTLELLKGDNSVAINSPSILSRYNVEMAVGLLQSFAVIGGFASTNNSNIEEMINDFKGACDSWLASMAATINRQIIADICDFNLKTDYPELKFVPVVKEKLNDLASYVSRLVQTQVITPTYTLEKMMLEKIHVPMADDVKPTMGFSTNEPMKSNEELDEDPDEESPNDNDGENE